jgi:pyridoxal phosphate phosphatase PHOSPHO2
VVVVALAMARVVVLFDFDKTMIDCDSDNWIVDELGVTELFTQLLPTLPWNSLMVYFLSYDFFFLL